MDVGGQMSVSSSAGTDSVKTVCIGSIVSNISVSGFCSSHTSQTWTMSLSMIGEMMTGLKKLSTK